MSERVTTELAPADRNKTELTLRVTEAASVWLAGLGAKCVETEVWISDKWVADLAGIWSPTRTEAQAHKLIPRTRYDYRAPHDERQQHYRTREDAYASIPSRLTIALEVKTSIGDFRSDDKWYRAPPADMRVLVIPSGLMPKDRWPTGWWVVTYTEAGGCRVASRAPLTPIEDSQRFRIAAEIAERQHNRQLYAFNRDLARSHRVADNQDTSLLRFNSAIEAVLSYLENGGDFEQHFSLTCMRNKARIPHWLEERMAAVYAKLHQKDQTQ